MEWCEKSKGEGEWVAASQSSETLHRLMGQGKERNSIGRLAEVGLLLLILIL